MQGATIGVGGSLRRVRESRGLDLEEASRDTRIRREFLEALEADDFDRLLGDVHARGCLRTYASYLRLSPDKVVAAYVTARPEAAEPDVHVVALPPEPVIGARRRRDNHRLLVMAASTVLVLAAAFGVLSARQPAPPPAEPQPEPSVVAVTAGRSLSVAVLARQPVDVTIVADGGAPQRFSFAVGEGRSFEATTSIAVRLSEGGTARVTVSGTDKGFPGVAGKPWRETYQFGTGSPSP